MISQRGRTVQIILAALLCGVAASGSAGPVGDARWSLEGTRLFGVHDLNSLHFRGAKIRAFLDDARAFGNCTLIVLERSDRACRGGWWEKVKEGGYVAQFGHYVRLPGEDGTLDPRALAKLEAYWNEARIRRIFVITTLFNPWDTKQYGVWQTLHGASCDDERRIFRTPGPPGTLERQRRFARLVAKTARRHPNVILSDNWEEGSPKAGVDLAWKREIYRAVREGGFTGPYLVYVGDRHGFDDREATLNWVRDEPGITGIQVHYEFPSPASLGLRPDQRVVHTEDAQLMLGPTPERPENHWVHQVFAHARKHGVECCAYTCDWRDFMRTDGGTDPLKGMREEALRRLEAARGTDTIPR